MDGNHGKFFEFKAGFGGSGNMGAPDSSHWLSVALEHYKPEANNPSWKGVHRTELIGKRGETPKFHVRYFEVQVRICTHARAHTHLYSPLPPQRFLFFGERGE